MMRALATAVALLALLAAPSFAEEDGVDSTLYFEGTVGCGSPDLEGEGCHTGVASADAMVELDGPPSIDPGEGFGVFTARATSPLLDRQGAGVNVLLDPTANEAGCVLEAFSEQLVQIDDNEDLLSHRDATTTPPLGSIGVFEYTFLLTSCTVPGNVRLVAAMNLFDGSGDETGEVWNRAETTVTVPEPAAAAAAVGATGALAAVAARRRRRLPA
jgi:hypothetical protein